MADIKTPVYYPHGQLKDGHAALLAKMETSAEKSEHIALAINAHAALLDLRAKYNRLHDVLSDCIESGRLTETELPDDYKALTGMLQQCAMADSAVAEILKGK